jgi:hypothetical protein
MALDAPVYIAVIDSTLIPESTPTVYKGLGQRWNGSNTERNVAGGTGQDESC